MNFKIIYFNGESFGIIITCVLGIIRSFWKEITRRQSNSIIQSCATTFVMKEIYFDEKAENAACYCSRKWNCTMFNTCLLRLHHKFSVYTALIYNMKISFLSVVTTISKLKSTSYIIISLIMSAWTIA
jgi:hypothetical protein